METMRIKNVGELKTASDGRQYFGVELSAGLGQRSVTRQMWEQFKRDSKTGLPTTEKYWERGSHAEFKAALGSEIQTAKITRNVIPYTIGEDSQPRNTYSSVIFPDENEVTLFANAGHNIVSEDGQILGKERAVLAKQGEASPKVAEKATV